MPFSERGRFYVKGGILSLGGDVELRRQAANLLRTPDALEVGGTARVIGTLNVGSAIIQASGAGSANFSGTPFVVPHGAIAPGLTQNGEIKTYDPVGAGKFSMRIGGTIYTLAFPSATHGTATITVGTPT